MQILATLVREFCFCQREPELPRFLFHIIIEVKGQTLSQCLFQFDIRHTKTILSLCSLPIFAFFPECAKCLCFKEPPNHINKAKFHAIPIDRKYKGIAII